MSVEITLPTGLSGSIRELGVIEENLLSDPKLARTGKNLHKVLENCWLETLDPGIYNFGDKPFDVLQLLQGDSMVYLIKLRIETYGPEFVFDVNCPHCGQKIPWELDLNEFLEVQTKELPEESARIIKEENGMFETVLPRSEKKVTFRLMNLRDEMRFPHLRRQSSDKLSSTLLDLSINAIDGVENKKAFLGLLPYPKNHEGEKLVCSSSDAQWIREEMEEVNCGLMTQFDVECMQHGEVPVELPFRDNFFLPKRHRR